MMAVATGADAASVPEDFQTDLAAIEAHPTALESLSGWNAQSESWRAQATRGLAQLDYLDNSYTGKSLEVTTEAKGLVESSEYGQYSRDVEALSKGDSALIDGGATDEAVGAEGLEMAGSGGLVTGAVGLVPLTASLAYLDITTGTNPITVALFGGNEDDQLSEYGRLEASGDEAITSARWVTFPATSNCYYTNLRVCLSQYEELERRCPNGERYRPGEINPETWKWEGGREANCSLSEVVDRFGLKWTESECCRKDSSFEGLEFATIKPWAFMLFKTPAHTEFSVAATEAPKYRESAMLEATEPGMFAVSTWPSEASSPSPYVSPNTYCDEIGEGFANSEGSIAGWPGFFQAKHPYLQFIDAGTNSDHCVKWPKQAPFTDHLVGLAAPPSKVAAGHAVHRTESEVTALEAHHTMLQAHAHPIGSGGPSISNAASGIRESGGRPEEEAWLKHWLETAPTSEGGAEGVAEVPLPGAEEITELAEALQAANPTTTLTTEQLETIAGRCLGMTTEAGNYDGEMECKTLPIFLSGSDVAEATEHDLKALSPITGHPEWVQLNYESAEAKEAIEPNRTWYNAFSPCSEEYDTEVDSCDEYPFYASRQGGGKGVPPASLEVIDREDNAEQGRKYGNFVTSCAMATRSSTDYAFLAIPLDPSFGIPTTRLCN